MWKEAEEGVRGDCIMCSPGKEDVPFPEDGQPHRKAGLGIPHPERLGGIGWFGDGSNRTQSFTACIFMEVSIQETARFLASVHKAQKRIILTGDKLDLREKCF